MSNEIDEVCLTAQKLFSRMAKWEERACASFPARDAVREDLQIELKQIFDDHLTQKAASREQRRYVELRYTKPPEFARPITKVEPAEPGAYWVQVEDWLHGPTRFHFVKHHGIWKIDYCQVQIGDDKWQRQIQI